MTLPQGPLIPIVGAAAILIMPFTGLMPDYWITLFN
jgi:branched-chain amino acid transport system permease protein